MVNYTDGDSDDDNDDSDSDDDDDDARVKTVRVLGGYQGGGTKGSVYLQLLKGQPRNTKTHVFCRFGAFSGCWSVGTTPKKMKGQPKSLDSSPLGSDSVPWC